MSVAYTAPSAGNIIPLDAYRPATAPAAAPVAGPDIETYRRLFTQARDMTVLTRERALKYRRYYDGDQWDKKARQAKELRREPTFAINRVRPGIEGMIGVVEKGKSDPRAYPRTPQDEDAAEVATNTLRYVKDQNRWHQNKLKAFRNILVEGTAAILIEVDSKLEVKLRRIRFEEFFYDPYSREPDFSDASYMGIAKWQYVDEIVAAYPEFEAELRASCDHGAVADSTWDDRPHSYSATQASWSDPKRKRMLIVEMYKREAGIWLKCCFVGELKLEEGPSPYQDNDGQPCNPIEAYTAYVDDDNRRYGVVEDMIGPQDEINVYRTKLAWLATFRQLQETSPDSAGVDPDEARREAARPDGVIPSGWTIVPSSDRFSMDASLLAEAKSEIERLGPAPDILGRQSADSSGRSQLIRQQAGLTELAHLFSGLEDLETRIWTQVWARVRQFWTQPKFIRVTDNPDSMKFIQINEPVWGPPAPVIDPTTGMPQYDPVTRQVVMRPQYLGMKNAVAEVGVDIIVDSTPDTANVQQEQYNALVQLAQIPGALGTNPGMILIKASSLPMKRELLEELDQQTQAAQAAAAQQQQVQAPPLTPAQQEAQNLALLKERATIEKTTAQGHLANAQAVKAQAEARVHDATAETVAPLAHAAQADFFNKGQLQQAKAVGEVVDARNALENAQGTPAQPAQPDF
jgi:hypothetical protein